MRRRRRGPKACSLGEQQQSGLSWMKLVEDTQTGTVLSPPSCCRLGRNNEDTEVGGGRSDSETVGEEGFSPSSTQTEGGMEEEGSGSDLRSCRGFRPRSGASPSRRRSFLLLLRVSASAHVLSCCWRSAASGQAGALLVKDGCKDGWRQRGKGGTQGENGK